ncbi:MAG: hypothetical protein MJ200_02700 [Mycoplasmoidaceae bacterium]|nr:hypothetical protein [Mycoplasmoidaceae bacterium]
MSTKYDYTGTDPEILARLSIAQEKYEATTNYLFNLDFQMSEYVQNEITLKRNQISTYDNVAQIGICEVGSTVTVVKEGEASPAHHFIEPSAAY